MKIAITADPEVPVPARHYGGIQRVIELLMRGLQERGHVVTLFASAESRVPCELAAYRVTVAVSGVRELPHSASPKPAERLFSSRSVVDSHLEVYRRAALNRGFLQ